MRGKPAAAVTIEINFASKRNADPLFCGSEGAGRLLDIPQKEAFNLSME